MPAKHTKQPGSSFLVCLAWFAGNNQWSVESRSGNDGRFTSGTPSRGGAKKVDSTHPSAYAAGVKRIVFIPMLAASLALAQEAPKYYFQDRSAKPEDLLKRKSAYSGKAFDTKAFDTKATPSKSFETKTFPEKEFKTKPAETKEFASKSSDMAVKSYETKSFESPKPKSWWQKLFGTKTATEDGKTFATTNVPMKMDDKYQEKIDHPKKPDSFKTPTFFKPTPENMNKPVGK